MAKTDYNMVVMTYVCVIAQLVTAFLVKDASWFNVILLAYTFGGCMTHLLWSSEREREGDGEVGEAGRERDREACRAP